MITTVNKNNNSNAFKKKRSFRYSAGSTTYLMTNLSIYPSLIYFKCHRA
nr:hypothetical protein [Mycoplasmopsis bovis]